LLYVTFAANFAAGGQNVWGYHLVNLTAAILVLALGAKETTISLPAALLLYDFIFLSNGDIRKVVRRWPFHTPFLAGGLAAAFYLAWFGNLRGSVGTGASGISPYSYFLTELRVIVRYVQITLIPSGLNLAYDFPLSNSFWEPRVILSSYHLSAVLSVSPGNTEAQALWQQLR
jgi:hypothetical protein